MKIIVTSLVTAFALVLSARAAHVNVKMSKVHLCCKCVTTVDEALKPVAGVKGHTAEKNAKSFEVTGDFNDKDVFSALHKAGFAGKVAK